MALEKFHYTTEAGVKITLPKFMQGLTTGFVRRIRKMDPGSQLFEIVEAVADEETLALIDDLGPAEFGELAKAWQKDAGIDLGESSASAS